MTYSPNALTVFLSNCCNKNKLQKRHLSICVYQISGKVIFQRKSCEYKLSFWNPNSLDLEKIIPITQHLFQHLQWCLHSVNTFRGRSLHLEEAGVTKQTIKQFKGNGTNVTNTFLSIVQRWKQYFITETFSKSTSEQNVLIRCDNTTVVQYINKQGETKHGSYGIGQWIRISSEKLLIQQDNQTFQQIN